MLTDREEQALKRIRVLRAASYRCADCGALASRVEARPPGDPVALCPRHSGEGFVV